MYSNEELDNKRILIIKAYKNHYQGSDAQKASVLAEKSVSLGLQTETPTLVGADFKRWIKSERAPLWAYPAALALLQTTDYQPKEGIEQAVFERVAEALINLIR